MFAQGRLTHWRLQWRTGEVIPLVSQETALELVRALAYPKFRLTEAEQAELLADYLPYCESVILPHPRPATPPCRDPADIPFLELALVGHARAIVTGDKDLLALGGVFACPIMTPESWRELYP